MSFKGHVPILLMSHEAIAQMTPKKNKDGTSICMQRQLLCVHTFGHLNNVSLHYYDGISSPDIYRKKKKIKTEFCLFAWTNREAKL